MIDSNIISQNIIRVKLRIFSPHLYRITAYIVQSCLYRSVALLAQHALWYMPLPVQTLNGHFIRTKRTPKHLVRHLSIVTILLCSLGSEIIEGYGKHIPSTLAHNLTPHAGYQPYQKAGDFVRLWDKMNGNDTEVTTWTMSSTSASASMDTGFDTTQDTSSSDRTAGAGQMNAMMRCGPGSSRRRSTSDGGSRDE